ncbi:MAG: Uma2 family endonuclease [Acidobacteria bacterium]|nr:Uma2 family endonuclease [Acidobacteriota bacterium]
MAVTSALLTVAEFEALPQPRGGVRLELHHGELFEMPPVKKLHTRVQIGLLGLLLRRLGGSAYGAAVEFPFRPLREHEVWVADVAVFDQARWAATADDDYHTGVPDVVIEVLSPTNTASEMLDRESVCLRNGGQEFWLVDPKRETVKVVTAGGQSAVYDVDGLVESRALGVSIAVRDIFYS